MGSENMAVRLQTLLRSWPRVETAPHRFGGVEFRVDRREIGHVHPSGMLDLPFPVRMRRDLVSAGRAEAHHMLPNTGWVTFRIKSEHDLPAAVDLLRLNYDRLIGANARRTTLPIVGKATMVSERDVGDMPT